MTGTETRGYLLDTTALTALASSRRVSLLITTAPHFHLPLYTPVTCVDAADRIRPGIARHVGRIPAVEPVDLTYSAVLDLRERTPQTALDVAHVVSLAHPSPDWSAGLVVATTQPDLYTSFDLPTYPSTCSLDADCCNRPSIRCSLHPELMIKFCQDERVDWSRDALAKRGFTGFVLFAELSSADVPTMPGVYVVLRPASATAMVKGSESGTGVAGTSGN